MGLEMSLIKRTYVRHWNFLNDKSTHQVPSKQIYAKDEFMWLYDEKTTWADTDIDNVVDYYRNVVNYGKKNNAQDVNVKENFKYDFVCEKYVQTIEKYFNDK